MTRALVLTVYLTIALLKGVALKISEERQDGCPELNNRQFMWSDPRCESPLRYGSKELMQAFSVEQEYWSQQGSTNPWWAVLTGFEQGIDIPVEAKLRFYASGVDWSAAMTSHLSQHNANPKLKGRALDLGCGLGRMSNALASMGFDDILCVDQAKSFLKEAKTSLAEFEGRGVVVKDALKRISFVHSGPNLLCKVMPGTVDFVHSVITLQHMKSQLQVAYIEQMCDALRVNGIGYFGMPVDWFVTDMHAHCNLNDESFGMMMHYTPQSEIVKHLNNRGCSVVGIVDYDDVGTQAGVSKRFIFRKT